jgi:para-nitrobenzyl esterase
MIKAVMRAVQDAKAAIRFFRKDVAENGNTYGIDPNQIFIGGSSAGGIAALHLAYINEISELAAEYQVYANEIGGLEGMSGNEGYSSAVKGVVTVSSAMRDVDYMNDNTDIPVLFVHAPFDMSIPYGIGKPYGIPTLPLVYGSKTLHAHAKEIGLPSTLYKVPGNQHVPYKDNEDNLIPAVFDSTIWYMSHFLYEYIECETPTPVKDHSTPALGIYPNPAANGFYIDTRLTETRTIQFINNLGELCRVEILNNGENFLSLKNASTPAGIYLLQLFDESKKLAATGKLVVR